MIDVLVLGDANPDLVLRGDVVPRFGQAEQLLDAATLELGGSAAIMAHAMARLGRSTRLSALIGHDTFGDAVIDILTTEGVDVSAVLIDPTRPTGVTVVLSRGQERAILTFPGAIAALSVDQAVEALDVAANDGARHLHVSSFFLQPALATGLADVFARAHSRGMTTSLDPNFDPAERWEGIEKLLPHLDVFLPNRVEAVAIAATVSSTGAGDVIAAGRALASRGPAVVIKDGSSGALRVDPDGSVLREAGNPVEAVDSTGAGDTFNAAFLDSMLSGLPASVCLRRAALGGALSTTAFGGTAGQPTLDQLVSFDPSAKDSDVIRQR